MFGFLYFLNQSAITKYLAGRNLAPRVCRQHRACNCTRVTEINGLIFKRQVPLGTRSYLRHILLSSSDQAVLQQALLHLVDIIPWDDSDVDGCAPEIRLAYFAEGLSLAWLTERIGTDRKTRFELLEKMGLSEKQTAQIAAVAFESRGRMSLTAFLEMTSVAHTLLKMGLEDEPFTTPAHVEFRGGIQVETHLKQQRGAVTKHAIWSLLVLCQARQDWYIFTFLNSQLFRFVDGTITVGRFTKFILSLGQLSGPDEWNSQRLAGLVSYKNEGYTGQQTLEHFEEKLNFKDRTPKIGFD